MNDVHREMEDAGWRAKIGWIQPPRGALDPFEILEIAPPGLRVIPMLTYVEGANAVLPANVFYQIGEQVEHAASVLQQAGADIVAQSGSPLTFLNGGLEGSLAMQRRVEDKVGLPFVMMGMAVLNAAKAHGFKRAAVSAAGYSEEWRDGAHRFLEDGGIEVLGIENWVDQQIFHNQEEVQRAMQPLHSKVTLGMSYKGAVTIARKCPDADCLFVLSGGIVVLPIIEALEQDLGIPVITSAGATFWEIFHRLGIGAPIEGHGSLLAGLAKTEIGLQACSRNRLG